jgi:hypothetical protein
MSLCKALPDTPTSAQRQTAMMMIHQNKEAAPMRNAQASQIVPVLGAQIPCCQLQKHPTSTRMDTVRSCQLMQRINIT